MRPSPSHGLPRRLLPCRLGGERGHVGCNGALLGAMAPCSAAASCPAHTSARSQPCCKPCLCPEMSVQWSGGGMTPHPARPAPPLCNRRRGAQPIRGEAANRSGRRPKEMKAGNQPASQQRPPSAWAWARARPAGQLPSGRAASQLAAHPWAAALLLVLQVRPQRRLLLQGEATVPAAHQGAGIGRGGGARGWQGSADVGGGQ